MFYAFQNCNSEGVQTSAVLFSRATQYKQFTCSNKRVVNLTLCGWYLLGYTVRINYLKHRNVYSKCSETRVNNQFRFLYFLIYSIKFNYTREPPEIKRTYPRHMRCF